MRVIIVEDDHTKIQDLEDELQQIEWINIVQICESYRSGLDAIFSMDFDLLILDMTLPLYDHLTSGGEGRKIQLGGDYILMEMKEEGLLQKVIVISQHDYFADYGTELDLATLGRRLKSTYGDRIVDTILYDSAEFSDQSTDAGWREKLLSALQLCQIN